MRTIYKYPLERKIEQSVWMPEQAGILTAKMQNGELMLWAVVETDFPLARREIRILGTGHPIEKEELHYIATVQDEGFVWHIFEAP